MHTIYIKGAMLSFLNAKCARYVIISSYFKCLVLIEAQKNVVQ